MTNNTPVLSIVICTYNRDKFIGKSLECLTNQTLSASLYEVIIVDNNSTDNTAHICHTFIAAHTEYNIRYVFEKNKGLSFARNRGIAEAQSNIVTYIDDDAEAVPQFAESIYMFLNTHKEVIGIGGKVVPIYPEGGEPKWMNNYLKGFVGSIDFGNEPKLFTGKMKYPAGCNMTYRKEILQQAGGFNNELTFRSDDKYIFFKVSEIANSIYYLPQAQVYHNIDSHRLTFDNFKKLFLKTGNEEKVRIRSEGNSMGLVKKFIELLIKAGASLLLYLLFLLKGQEIKGRYVVYAQWFTFKGFLMENVFVR